jgi:hypothetical protein
MDHNVSILTEREVTEESALNFVNGLHGLVREWRAKQIKIGETPFYTSEDNPDAPFTPPDICIEIKDRALGLTELFLTTVAPNLAYLTPNTFGEIVRAVPQADELLMMFAGAMDEEMTKALQPK